MSSTVIRVKRRLEDNPQDALVLVCKRIKTDAEEISPSLFVFHGTVHNPEIVHVKNIVPKIYKLKSHNVDKIIEKIRKERKDESSESRYKVVNCRRGLKEASEDAEDTFDIVDLHYKSESEGFEEQYAYDLYTAMKQDFDVSMIDNLVSIENFETDLVFGSNRGNGHQMHSDEADDDDDDSNDENNWRNDYPESEPSSIHKDDMITAMEKCDIENELSSDTGQDEINGEPSHLVIKDVKSYGEAYSQYKAKVLSAEPSVSDSLNLVHCSKVKVLDEESVEGYKEGSEDGFYYGEEQDTEQFRDQYGNDSSEEYSPD